MFSEINLTSMGTLIATTDGDGRHISKFSLYPNLGTVCMHDGAPVLRSACVAGPEAMMLVEKLA